jgi:hypothetical protein
MPITFDCEGCGKFYTVPDEVAGRTARCKQCGTSNVIPTLRPKAKPASPATDKTKPVPRPRIPPVPAKKQQEEEIVGAEVVEDDEPAPPPRPHQAPPKKKNEDEQEVVGAEVVQDDEPAPPLKPRQAPPKKKNEDEQEVVGAEVVQDDEPAPPPKKKRPAPSRPQEQPAGSNPFAFNQPEPAQKAREQRVEEDVPAAKKPVKRPKKETAEDEEAQPPARQRRAPGKRPAKPRNSGPKAAYSSTTSSRSREGGSFPSVMRSVIRTQMKRSAWLRKGAS